MVTTGMGWGLLVVACVVWCQLDAWLHVWALVVYLERRRTDVGRCRAMEGRSRAEGVDELGEWASGRVGVRWRTTFQGV